MFRSIRWRLVLSFVLVTLLAVSSVGGVALLLVKQIVEQQEIDHLTANAESVARQALPLMQPTSCQEELKDLVESAALLSSARIRILDAQRLALVDSGARARASQLWWLLPQGTLQIEEIEGEERMFILAPSGELATVISPTEFTMIRRWDGQWGSRIEFDPASAPEVFLSAEVDERPPARSERAITVAIGGADDPAGYVEISNGPDFGTETLRTTGYAFLVAAAVAMVMAAVAGLVVSRGLTAPLQELTEVAGKISSGELSTRAPVRRRDEVGQLAGQFNQMADRLEASFRELGDERDALRNFITDASHELRTPITVLKSFNELLQGTAADDPSARAEFLLESQVQIDRLERITHDLLDLSRLDAGLLPLEVTTHDVGELIESAASAFKTLAREKQLDLSIRTPAAPLELECDRARIEMALSNLLDNAVKFTPAGGSVEIGADQTGDTVRLWVRDTGPGIDPTDQPHIFKRFYQGINRHPEGRGLGLAIVQSVVRAHGGQVSLASEAGAGSLFAIELPQD